MKQKSLTTGKDERTDTQGTYSNKSSRGVLYDVLTSQSFVEKIALLILTILLSGLIIPIIINNHNAELAQKQKFAEQTKARNETILQAQQQLLNEAAEVILTLETLALDVSWYGESANRSQLIKAYDRYSEEIIGLISNFRVLTIRAQILASSDVSKKMSDFHKSFYSNQDIPINQLYTKNASTDQWRSQHIRSQDMLAEANELILTIAKDLNLSRDDIKK